MARQKIVRDTVVPVTRDGKVFCGECDAEMRPWNYVEIPSQHRWILWRCLWDDDHITSMVPEYRRR